MPLNLPDGSTVQWVQWCLLCLVHQLS